MNPEDASDDVRYTIRKPHYPPSSSPEATRARQGIVTSLLLDFEKSICVMRFIYELGVRGGWQRHDVDWRRVCRTPDHAVRHCCTMFVAEMAVCLSDQHAAILVTQPASNDLEVNPGFDGVATKEVSARMMTELRQPRFF